MIPWWLNPWAEVSRARGNAARLRLILSGFQDEFIKADRELSAIKRQRSEATRKGNLTKAANRRAKQDQITEKLRAEVTA